METGAGARTRKGWRRAAVWAVQLALTVAITWAILARLGFSMDQLAVLGSARRRPAFVGLVASSVLLLGGFVLTAWFWGRLLAAFGGQRLGFWDANRIYFLANLGRYLPGKVWQIAGLAYLARDAGVSSLAATGAAVLAQGLTLLGAFLLGILPLVAGATANGVGRAAWVGVLVAAAITVLVVPPLFRRAVAAAFRVLRRSPPNPDALDSLFGLRWLVLYTLAWMVYGVAFWSFARAFAITASVGVAAGAFAGAYFAGYVAIFAPAGIGVREGVLAALLAPHVPAAEAVALAVLARVWTTIVELVPATAFAVRHALRARRPTPGR
ncbi:MAG: flippase-like domain-containing protein [Gemmatimonadetes bacterium]|nr:flippase-like domain-containing protein [Gemmatimonadota bacterium]